MTQYPTPEEIKQIAKECDALIHEILLPSLTIESLVFTTEELQAFADRMIEIGRKMQRESDMRPVAADVLTAELDDKRDAERFRWLLENCTDFMRPVNGVLTNGRFKYKRGSCFSPREAIDIAIRNNTGE